MIARLALAAEALIESLPPGVPITPTHRALAATVNAHGQLIFADDADETEFATAAAILDHNVSKIWTTLLEELKKKGRVNTPDGTHCTRIQQMRDLSDLRRDWSGKVDVVVVDSPQANVLGVTHEDQICADDVSHIEIATMMSAPYTQRIDGFRQLITAGRYPVGTPREVFWDQVLQPLAGLSLSATILDQYLLEELLRRQDRYRRLVGPPEHLVWLLQHLDTTMPPGATLELLTSTANDRHSAQEIASIVRGAWIPKPVGRLRKVTVRVHRRRSSDFPHDRHIRFRSGLAVELSAGFDQLSQLEIRDRDGMGWYYWHEAAALRAKRFSEKMARELPSTAEAIVLSRNEN